MRTSRIPRWKSRRIRAWPPCAPIPVTDHCCGAWDCLSELEHWRQLSTLYSGRSSKGQVGADLDHAAVLNYQGLFPQWAVREIFQLNGTAVQHVVEVKIARQADPLRELHPFGHPQVESGIPIFK